MSERKRISMMRVTPGDEVLLQRLQERLGMSRSDVMREALRHLEAREFPPLCLGYVAVDRDADLGPEDECGQCGQALGRPYFVALMADGAVVGPLCSGCAESE